MRDVFHEEREGIREGYWESIFMTDTKAVPKVWNVGEVVPGFPALIQMRPQSSMDDRRKQMKCSPNAMRIAVEI